VAIVREPAPSREISERERIADELHDVLGEACRRSHSKAQFAGRLLEQRGDAIARERSGCGRADLQRRARDVRQTFAKYREESVWNRDARQGGKAMLQLNQAAPCHAAAFEW